MQNRAIIALAALVGICLFTSGCAIVESYGNYRERIKESRAAAQMREEGLLAHTAFRAETGWKRKTYRNETILALATPANVSLEIALKNQRGFLLVQGAIAMDFPVASGKRSHPTPSGKFAIRSKKQNYHSNLYGKIMDVEGNVLVADADTRRDVLPEGATFSGATMPYWMRLTDTGVGLHVGHVPGRPASHGCVRLKREAASKIFALVKAGTPVVIAESAPALNPKL
jgi:lipoprotein-anchoring transpeptidase ErfK/SrfK